MKKEQILQILTSEPPLVTLADAGKCLAKLVTEVYIVSGVHRTLTKEAFAEEITFATDYLLNAIRSGINGKSRLVNSLGRQTVFLYYAQLSRVFNDLSASGDQNLHFAAKFDIACASLSRNSHKR